TRLFGVNPAHAAAAIVWFPPVDGLALGETLALAVIGPLVARRLNIPAGAFLVPMIAGIVLTHMGWMSIELPTWLLAASYALVGWNVGPRLSRAPLLPAARMEPRPPLQPARADPCRPRPAARARLHPHHDRAVRRRRLADGAGD